MPRYDSIGMFWEDLPAKSQRGEITRTMPPIPDTGWVTPQVLPNLKQAPVIALDTETYDPELLEAGPGWARHRGELVGVSLAVPNYSWYFPIRHRIEPEYNMDPDKVLAWLKDTLSTNCPKIGTNITYDVGWLREEGVTVNGPLYDIQFAEALLNSETPSVSLEALAGKHLNLGKETSILYQWCADFYGGRPTDRQRANIYRAPPRLVGPYAEADASLPLRIMEKQWPLLSARGVSHLFDLECRLIRLMIDMRFKGTPIDIKAAEQRYDVLGRQADSLTKRIDDLVGFEVKTSDKGGTLIKAFEHFSLPYPYTKTGRPSITADVLESTDHDLCRMVLEHRRLTKIRNTFIKGYILDTEVDGKIYCQFHQLRGDENGTRSGRFSSSTPNLQNIPVRTEEGRLLRQLWRAPGGRWRKFDYSQIEYRLLAHHAVGPGSDNIRRRYIHDPDTDYHQEVGDMVEAILQQSFNRRSIKTLNFGMVYGMGKKELLRRIGAGGESIYTVYHKAVPFLKDTLTAASRFADTNGYITTILDRRSDFPLFGPYYFDREAKVLPLDAALAEYGQVKRAFTHKALNRKLQGGAADLMKLAMVNCYESGIFDDVGIPLLTLHDELDFDDYGEVLESSWLEMVHIMETCMPNISVPIKVASAIGDHWGDVD